MREIKFRIWDKIEHKMKYDAQNTYDYMVNNINENCFGDVLENEIYEVMQYIGIHDVDGNEIYEGDVVVRTSDRTKYVVKWFSKCARFALSTNNEPDKLPMIMFLLENTRVIGNVYQNPELLEGMESSYPRVGVDED